MIPILHQLEKNWANKIKRRYVKEMFVFGLAFSLLSTLHFLSTYPLSWLSITSPLVSVVIIGGVWFSFAVAMAVPIMWWPMIVNKLRSHSQLQLALVGASAWVGLEFLRSVFISLSLYGSETVFGPHHTYYSLGYTFPHLPVLKEVLAMGGIYLASFLAILINFLLYYLYISWKKKQSPTKEIKTLTLTVILIIFVCFVTLQIIRSKEIGSPEVEATIISTNFPSGTKYTQSHKDLATSLAPGGVSDMSNIVISPEGFQVDQLFLAPKEDSQQLFIGTTAGSAGKVMYFNEFKTKNIFYRSKYIMMPIGDYRLAWTDIILKHTQSERWLEGYFKRYVSNKETPEYSLYRDPDSPLVIAGSVCSDNISPYIFRNGAKEGATLLLNIASHAPFRGSEILTRENLAVNTTRAIENGRYFVTAANYENSMVISDAGDLIYRSTSDAIISFEDTKIILKNYTTPYVKFGDYVLIISFFILLFSYIKTKK
ncbi:hypothetical protein H6785_02515 [Candidatus Nomurabacteria bacterium]|nr:hypothetical protein [Candidatus Nomurabacteria bacterium]